MKYQTYLQIETVEAIVGGLSFTFMRFVNTMHLWVTQHQHFNETMFDMVVGYGFWGLVYGWISLVILSSKDEATRRHFAQLSGIAYAVWFPVFIPSIYAGRWTTFVVVVFVIIRGIEALANLYYGFLAPRSDLQRK